MEDTAVSLAHRYASEAEALEDRYMWEQAIDLHVKAGEHFLMAMNDTHSPEVVQTLKLMHANHTRQAKDLKRRLAKVQAATAAAASKASPKETGSSRPNSGSGGSPGRASANSATTAAPATSARSTDDSDGHFHSDQKGRHSSKQRQRTADGLRVGDSGKAGHQHGAPVDGKRRGSGHGERREGHSDDSEGEFSSRHHREASNNHHHHHQHHHHRHHHHHAPDHNRHSHHEPSSSSTLGSIHVSSNLSSTSSSATVEDSFTMIKTMRDDSDPFNKFWEALESLVQKISSPVAFASIPLDLDEPAPSVSVVQTDQPQQLQPHQPLLQPERPMSSLSSQLHTTSNWEDAPFAIAVEGPKQLSSSSTPRVSNQEPPPEQQLPQRQEHLVPLQQKRLMTSSKRESELESAMVDSYFIIDSPSAPPAKHPTPRSRSGSNNTSMHTVHGVGENSQRSKKTIEEYQIENQQLKLTLDRLSKRNQELEKSAQAAMQLKTNMNSWKQEVERRAMQLKQSQDMLRSVTMGKHTGQIRSADSSALLLKRPLESYAHPPSVSEIEQQQTGPSGQGYLSAASTVANNSAEDSSGTYPTAYELANPMTMQQRLKELTAELETLKLDNARQTALMRKYKQRWEDLKESAKRRRSGVKPEEIPGGGGSAPDNGNGNTSRASYGENMSKLPPGPHSSGRRQLPPQAAGSPFPNTVVSRGPQLTGATGSSSPLRPPTGLSRSSSASGPNLHPSGTYQRRIIMETNKGGLALEHISKYRNNHAPLTATPVTAGQGPGPGPIPSAEAGTPTGTTVAKVKELSL
ncbi:hypothetical protein DFQ26_006352 [Actinomortierella ambigua]|nr:hypothetical protein DFQ26_006352 [Actinomortierella ambigua]